MSLSLDWGRQGGPEGSGVSGRAFLPILFNRLPGRLYFILVVLLCEFAPSFRVKQWTSHTVTLALFGAAVVYLRLAHSYLRNQAEALPFRLGFFVANWACVAVYLAGIYASHIYRLNYRGVIVLQTVHYTSLTAAVFCLALAVVPFSVWMRTLRSTAPAWIGSVIAGGVLVFMHYNMSGAIRRLQSITISAVGLVLNHVLPGATVDSPASTIDAPHFSVFVKSTCSGWEGIALVLVFSSCWLWYFRREIRLFRASLLVLVALVCVALLNVVRISALILIGNYISPDIALNGFHSTAGWIMFLLVALAFAIACQNLAWLRRPAYAASAVSSLSGDADSATTSVGTVPASGESSLTSAYLLPFLLLLASAFVSRAASGSFDWLYPLRFFAGAIALWHYRAQLKQLNWRFGMPAVLVGAVIFVLWVAPSAFLHTHFASSFGPALLSISAPLRFGWIFFRILTAITIVPVAEELAFRGYLFRRIAGREFDRVPFTAVPLTALIISSLAFGLLHGSRWFVGTLAGLAFGAIVRKTGRIGDAVAAHAVSNLLLAVWVLVTGDWAQW